MEDLLAVDFTMILSNVTDFSASCVSCLNINKGIRHAITIWLGSVGGLYSFGVPMMIKIPRKTASEYPSERWRLKQQNKEIDKDQPHLSVIYSVIYIYIYV